MQKSLIWLKRDLRSSDQPLLSEWRLGETQPQFVYFKFREDDACSSVPKLQFRDSALEALQIEVQGGILVFESSYEEFRADFEALLESIQPGRVITSREYASYEVGRNNEVRFLCSKKGIDFEERNTFTLYDDLDPNLLPHVFTNFRKQIENQRVPVEGLDSINLQNQTHSGLRRLQYYFFESKKIQTYKKTRNGMLNPDDSTRFSPFLAQGILSVRRIWFEIQRFEKEYGENDSTYWMKFELLWREFFIWNALKHQNKLFLQGGIKGLISPYAKDEALFQDWSLGRTKDDFVNANMNELRLTGWMSNRGRQNVASYLIHDLNLDWRLGAQWFEQQLIDYEPCANWGNWGYLAGVGNDPRPHRKFNLEKQRAEYDPTGEYVRRWLNK